jgi:hypothetical protein
MFVDHAGDYLFPLEEWLRGIGRGAMPVFLVLTGYAARYRYSRELFLLGAVLYASQIFSAGKYSPPNILFTILLCRAVFAWLETNGKTITKPFEWYMVALAMSFTYFLVEYGSFALLFAICGYMLKNRARYTHKQITSFWGLTFVTHGVVQAAIHEYVPLTCVVMAVTLFAVYRILLGGAVEKTDPSAWPSWLARTLKFASYYSAYLYVGHIMVLQWMESFGLA